MESLGWTLIQYAWWPYKERKFGQRDVQREDARKSQGEDRPLQGKETGLEHTLPSQASEGASLADTLISDF